MPLSDRRRLECLLDGLGDLSSSDRKMEGTPGGYASRPRPLPFFGLGQHADHVIDAAVSFFVRTETSGAPSGF